MKTVYALSALAIVGAAFAQTTAIASATTTVAGSTASSSGTGKASGTRTSSKAASPTADAASAAIPTGISSTCDTFLTSLDSDPEFGSCTQPLLTATSAFAPTANNASLTTATLVSTLNTLCSSRGCTDTYVRTQLVNFNAACKQELSGSNPNTAVQDTYDILYLMIPMQGALCTRDTDGTYCALKAPSNSTAPASSSGSGTGAGPPNVANNYVIETDSQITGDAITTFQNGALVSTPVSALARRAASSDQTVMQYAPDTQVYRDTGVAYLFTLPTLSSASMCTSCFQAILTTYAKWESTTPYGRGLSQSTILGGQAQLWQAAASKCGSAFISAVQGKVGPVVHAIGGSLAGGSPAATGFSLRSGALALVIVAFSVAVAL